MVNTAHANMTFKVSAKLTVNVWLWRSASPDMVWSMQNYFYNYRAEHGRCAALWGHTIQSR